VRHLPRSPRARLVCAFWWYGSLCPANRIRVLKASNLEGSRQSVAGKLIIENVTGTDMLGRMPRIGQSACEMIAWRATNLGNCIEMAAAYEHCGKQDIMRDRLQKHCRGDWKMLVRYSLRTAMVRAMKVKTCASLNELVAHFAAEPFAKELEEYNEVRSLAQYACATEAKNTTKEPRSTSEIKTAVPSSRSPVDGVLLSNFTVAGRSRPQQPERMRRIGVLHTCGKSHLW
jgi:hypothetical protein